MEFYIFILVVLFFTALADLIVGVSNDAVNFLNSAVGSKAASRRTIMIVAALGVLVGTTFSSGMMEVARKGIFNPEYYVMHEVMIIFLAVMLTDILLLDLYNTFGLPTSTTVSIVFEILGGAVAIALVKVGFSMELFQHINSVGVLKIISGIALSVIFAFIFGVSIQFITRTIFTFNYQRLFKRYGAIYCGIALTAISIFIVIKGAKGSSLVTPEIEKWIMSHIWQFILYSMLGWTVIWGLIIYFTKLNVLKIIVLIGTFALALAFAANDLVNFIGAPLGALSAYEIGTATPGTDPLSITMSALKNPVQAKTWILLLAGVVMVVTLWRSRKAQSVTKTEVGLGRQDEGVERFASSALSRGIVRIGISLFEVLKKITPKTIQQKISKRINPESFKLKPTDDGEVPAFDLLRAAVNLMVASALVSFGTSLKLPLSTTFVTFMVAMSTSLADKAWGRESAVYRVNGVITVIGGWFFTAFMAFSTCFLFAIFIYFGKLPAILVLIFFGFYFYFRTARLHRQREAEYARRDRKLSAQTGEVDALPRIMMDISEFISTTANVITQCCEGLTGGKRKELKEAKKRLKLVQIDSDAVVEDILFYLQTSRHEEKGAAPRYGRQIGAMQIIAANLSTLVTNSYDHIDNNHKAPDEEQAEELKHTTNLLIDLLQKASKALERRKFSNTNDIRKTLAELKETIRRLDKQQMKRIKKGKTKTRQSLLFVSSLGRLERIGEQVMSLVELYKESAEEAHEEVSQVVD
ncbi:inorganic phosphate transporter [candidate division KSB1 bacterium]|nr:inorganic phosphate transporter [candidate division KSB1 bacterium]